MIRSIMVFALLLGVLGALAIPCSAAPSTIQIQGKLTRSGGQPLAGTRAWRVQFYSASSGGSALGSPLTGTVALGAGGRFAIAVAPPAAVLAATADVYYELAIDSAATPDGTISPGDVFASRVKVSSVLWAYKTLDADKVDGQHAAGFAATAHNHDTAQVTSGELPDARVSNTLTLDAASAVNGNAIKTGTVAEPLVDAAIARDDEIMPAVLAGDGPGSTFDADLLDGKHAAGLADAVHPHTAADITSGMFADERVTDTLTISSLGAVDGGAIKSGLVAEPRVDAALARDGEILPAVLAGDGSGSTLDADLVDGMHSGDFAASAHNHDAAHITSGVLPDPRISDTLTLTAASAVDGGAIKSGIVSEPRVDAALARDGEIMPTVLAGDGPGSSLDADLLDGQHAAAFMPAATDNWVNIGGDTMSGTLSVPSFRMPPGAAVGKVLTTDGTGLGTWQTPPWISGSGTDNRIPMWNGTGALENSALSQDSTGQIGIGTTSPDATLTISNPISGMSAGGIPSIMIGNPSGDCGIWLGQDSMNFGVLGWTNTGPGTFLISAAGPTKPLALQSYGGNVGIGTSDPVSRLQIRGGDLTFENQINSIRRINNSYDLAFCKDTDNDSGDAWFSFVTDGNSIEQLRINDGDEAAILADGTFTSNGIDYAEAYKVVEEDLEPGDVVSLAIGQPEHCQRAATEYDPALLGVISTKPSFVAGASFEQEAAADPQLAKKRDQARVKGDHDTEKQLTRQLQARMQELLRPVALLGRVPCKVVGPIKAGDTLTASATPGHAMHQARPGPSLGIALEDHAGPGTGKIMVFVRPGWHGGADEKKISDLEARIAELEKLVEKLAAK